MVTTSELRNKEVINIVDGKRLGLISDVKIDVVSGRLVAITVPGEGGLFRFLGGRNDLAIPWAEIVKIGVDVILVEVKNMPHLNNS